MTPFPPRSLVLAVAGCLVGVPLAMWATRGLARMQTFGVPLLQDSTVDLIALAVTIGVTTIAGIACGMTSARSRANSSARIAEA